MTTPRSIAPRMSPPKWPGPEACLSTRSTQLQPEHSRISIDGEEIEGDYLLVEVLNIASVGPRLRLSAETTPADGMLSLVIAVAGRSRRDSCASAAVVGRR